MRDKKHLVEHSNKLVEKAKEKALFRSQRKAVEAGAHGTLDYTIKKGVNKNKIAGEKILKSKKGLILTAVIHLELYWVRSMFEFMNFFKF